jgi:hypothetical protein
MTVKTARKIGAKRCARRGAGQHGLGHAATAKWGTQSPHTYVDNVDAPRRPTFFCRVTKSTALPSHNRYPGFTFVTAGGTNGSGKRATAI